MKLKVGDKVRLINKSALYFPPVPLGAVGTVIYVIGNFVRVTFYGYPDNKYYYLVKRFELLKSYEQLVLPFMIEN